MNALVLEIADKHDYIAKLRAKIAKQEERMEQLEKKVLFREKIIRELRRNAKNQQQVQFLIIITNFFALVHSITLLFNSLACTLLKQ
jgi:hypothetical protein